MRLFIFDRSGVLRSQSFNIHKNPEDFVRIILGFCSPRNDQIGFDPTVTWKKKEGSVESQQVKAEGGQEDADDATTEGEETDKVVDRAAKKRLRDDLTKIARYYDQFISLDNHWIQHSPGKKTYRVKNTLFLRDSLRGRGTKCWTVFDPDDEKRTLIIKDSWRTTARESEARLLTEVVDLPGVGQMVAYQDDGTDCVSNFREVTGCDMTDSMKHNRTFSRIVFEAYGGRLERFKDPMHLLCAFRDAIKGGSPTFTVQYLPYNYLRA